MYKKCTTSSTCLLPYVFRNVKIDLTTENKFSTKRVQRGNYTIQFLQFPHTTFQSTLWIIVKNQNMARHKVNSVDYLTFKKKNCFQLKIILQNGVVLIESHKIIHTLPIFHFEGVI